MTKKSKLEKVLVIDDEPDNVEPLLDFFNKSNVPYDFVNSVSDALEHILESQKHGTPYGCVICDNHLTEQYFDLTKGRDYSIANTNGIDIANVLIGKLDILDEDIRETVKEYFGKYIQEIAEHYSGEEDGIPKVIIFSGSAYEESQYRDDLFKGLEIVQKLPDQNGDYCEAELINKMLDMGYTFRIPIEYIKAYKREHGLEHGVRQSLDEGYDDDYFDNRVDDLFNDGFYIEEDSEDEAYQEN